MTAESTFIDEPRRRSIEDIRSEALHHALHWASQQAGGASPEKISSTAMEFEAYLKPPPRADGTGAFIDIRDAEILIFQYSEWLDPQYLKAPISGDDRTHMDLVKDFLATRNPNSVPYLGDPRPASN